MGRDETSASVQAMTTNPGSEGDGGSSATVELGRVAKAHGVLGEVKVKLHWAQSDLLLKLGTVTLVSAEGHRRDVTIEAARPAHDHVLLKLAGVQDRDEAEVLRGAALVVPRSALPEPEPGEFYLNDLVGLRVVGPDGDIGVVVEIRVHPSIDSIVIRRADGKLVEQPLGERWVDEVDFAERRVVLSTTDGLVE